MKTRSNPDLIFDGYTVSTYDMFFFEGNMVFSHPDDIGDNRKYQVNASYINLEVYINALVSYKIHLGR